MTTTAQFAGMTSLSKYLDVILFLLSSLVTGPSFMSISLLVLELWQFSFIRDWPEIRKSEIPPSEFCPASGDWGELCVPSLARIFLIKSYWMLENARITYFTVSELREFNRGVKITPTQIRVNSDTKMDLKLLDSLYDEAALVNWINWRVFNKY